MNKRTVLIVDDQKLNRSILRKILQNDYTIMEAENGKIALSLLKENPAQISAILLDVVMPVLDGYGVLEAMQGDPVLSKIPVIVSSQKDGDEDEEKALALGAQDFISKPYKAKIVHHRIDNMIKLRETASLINKVEKDELTGLLSKDFFQENVGKLLSENPKESFDMMSIGVEHFKLINDTYGVAKGDEFLRYMGHVLQEVEGAIYCSRFSADLFYIVTKHHEVYDEEIFHKITLELREFPIDMEIRINCGIYNIEKNDTNVSGICDRAQLAANKNKGLYDQRYSVYDDTMREKLLTEQFMATNMRAALSERQFKVYYQPKYDLNNEMIAGAEALVRWIHPVKGFLSPGDFIPFFEHNGFIMELDEYVWEQACMDIREWMDKGYQPVAVSVNVSRADVYNPKLTDILLGLVAKYEIPIRYLHLEITESAYTNNPAQIIKVVSNLRKLGFVIEMDDFGSGYSSLNMLAEMPVDVMKLDMGFVQHETNNKSGKGIMSFVISLAKWLNLAVVAEGVETSEQIATLRTMDCNYVQGFYFAKPMKKEEFDALLSKGPVQEMICNSQTAKDYLKDTPEELEEERRNLGVADKVMLIVDDIEVNRAVLASAFYGWFTIVEKENGKEAWEYLQRNSSRVAVVLLDLLMPVMDGFQLLEYIRENADTRDIPVIVTSQGTSDSELRTFDMQADDFIAKPYTPEIVQHRVRNAIEVRYLHKLQKDTRLAALLADYRSNIDSEVKDQDGNVLTTDQKCLLLADSFRPYFDIVRLVDPERTLVYNEPSNCCDIHACYSVWGKASRCNNCISLRAMKEKGRHCKLEYSNDGLFFVISQYVPYGERGAVMEMVTKLEDEYVDNVLDKPLLYAKLDALNEQLNCDELTGIYNRRFIDQNLDKYISSTKKRKSDLGVAMVDVDAFKSLNDLYGHQTGDAALRTVAMMLRDNIAVSKGDFVARYGGDEFLIVCRNISKEVFKKRLEAVSKLVRYITDEKGVEIPISISAGCISLSEQPQAKGKELINLADMRLYKAKIAGRGRIVTTE